MRKALPIFLSLWFLGGCAWSVPSIAAPDLGGHWTLNEDESDDVQERLQGLTVIRSKPKSQVAAEREREGLGRKERIYSELELAEERRSINRVAEVGELTHVLHTESLTVAALESGVEITYDQGFKRHLKPRTGGRRYSAKGDEFTPDELGRGMVYWRENILVIETLLAPRGTMTEELSLKGSPRRLKVHTVLRNPDWLVDADIVRVFDAGP
jgi:hypothetical protein